MKNFKITVLMTDFRISSRVSSLSVLFAVFVLIFVGSLSAAGQNANSFLPAEKTSWHGFDRYDYILDMVTLEIIPFKSEGEGNGVKEPEEGKRRCILVMPKKAAEGNPWSWRGCYWDHQPQTEIELLNRGFCVVYITANHQLKPGKHWEAWYDFLTQKIGLSTKPAFVGMSRGGEYSYIWATTHPDKVSSVYADNPGGNWDIMKGIAGMVQNDVPVLEVCGSIDPILGKFSLPIEKMYQQLGGRFSMIMKEGSGHHPHSLHNPKMIADFIEQSFNESKPAVPGFANEESTRKSFYNPVETYTYSEDEGTFLTRRGPFFSNCYNRYEVGIKGVEGSTNIIEPVDPLPGKPWVLRADYVDWDAVVNFELLEKGYYIVTGAVPYNFDGPVLSQWDLIYKYLSDQGFAKKVILEGKGRAAGEVYAWGIENTDKVACIYAENPILHSTLAKVQPIDNLEPLAKAGVPVLHFCGKLDPNYQSQTIDVEKKYKKAGGKITVLVNEGEAHDLSFSRNTDQIVKFISDNSK